MTSSSDANWRSSVQGLGGSPCQRGRECVLTSDIQRRFQVDTAVQLSTCQRPCVVIQVVLQLQVIVLKMDDELASSDSKYPVRVRAQALLDTNLEP